MDAYAAGPHLSKIEHPSDLRSSSSLKNFSRSRTTFVNSLWTWSLKRRTLRRKLGGRGTDRGTTSSTPLKTKSCGTSATRRTATKSSPAVGRNSTPTANTKGCLASPSQRKRIRHCGVGHSSTSISAALGMAVGSRHNGAKDTQHVAVIGDGAMTAGLAFEGLNHGGAEDTNMLVVLNDNCMSIDPNVGALKDYLLTSASTPTTASRTRSSHWVESTDWAQRPSHCSES